MDSLNSESSTILQNQLIQILESHPEGISEFDLIKILISEGFLEKSRLDEEYSLFQSHFVLFHYLYLIRENLRSSGTADLEIHFSMIRIKKFERGSDYLLTSSDKLAQYYLNSSNLNTSPKEVSEMISNFWKKFSEYRPREEALSILGLEDPIDDSEILVTYRKLIRENHPDSGGDGSKINIYNEAKKSLLG